MNNIGILSFLFILLNYLLINNAQAHLEGEGIIGGEDSDPGEYTYQVSLNKRFESICGGTIIGDQHVVTAAHCVTDDNGDLLQEPIKVVAGTNNLKNKRDRKRVDINVETVYIPKIYNEIKRSYVLKNWRWFSVWNSILQGKKSKKKQIVGDIAVLKLDRPFDFRSRPHLSKLKLGDPSESYAGKTAVVTGFGWNYIFTMPHQKTNAEIELTGMSYDRLRFAQTIVLSNEVCSRFFKKLVSESHLCAQVVQKKEAEPQGVCSGDSGGPLTYGGDTLIGVLSASPIGCKENIKPAVYTRVSSYLDFIEKAVNNVKDPQILSTQVVIY